MKKIRLWSIGDNNGASVVEALDPVDNTETEELLEGLLVADPDLLDKGLTLVGRQVPTDGGFLDLLGIDEDGRIVVFELKRGQLTRDAVAQVLDYASDIATYDTDRFARLVEQHSGRGGVNGVEDFEDWFNQERPGSSAALSEIPRMVLVGLGADNRARRIVDLLAQSGIEIELITFHGFRSADGGLLLARQVEIAGSSSGSRDTGASATRESNLEALYQRAEERGIKPLLENVAEFIESKLPRVYRWPGKTAFSFSLTERTDEGNPSNRVYVSLYVHESLPARLGISLHRRAVEAAGAAGESIYPSFPSIKRKEEDDYPIIIPVDVEVWPKVTADLGRLLEAIHVGWRTKMAEEPGIGG